MKKKRSKKVTEHYVDNETFFTAMCEWKELVIEAVESDEERPPISEYIGECFLKISEHLSRKPNFINFDVCAQLQSRKI